MYIQDSQLKGLYQRERTTGNKQTTTKLDGIKINELHKSPFCN